MNISQLKFNAARQVEKAGQAPGRLVLISVGVAMAASLLSAAVSFLVNRYEGGAGLSGMDAAQLLQTGDTLLSLGVTALSPFWNAGLLAVLFSVAMGRHPEDGELLTGFRRFGVFARLLLIRVVVILLLSFLLSTPASMLYLSTPWASSLENALMTNPNLLEDMAAMEAVVMDLVPMLVIYAALVLAAYLPFAYRMRLAEYEILSGQNSAVTAAFLSSKATRGRMWELVKLDISFWWYYLGHALLMGVLWLDSIAQWLHWQLPASADVSYWVCYGLYAVGYVALEVKARPWVECARVEFYKEVTGGLAPAGVQPPEMP